MLVRIIPPLIWGVKGNLYAVQNVVEMEKRRVAILARRPGFLGYGENRSA